MIRLALLLLTLATPAAAETALAGVAANFATTAETLSAAYEKQTGDRIEVTTGSTGKLYAQIGSGAPYDLMLSADQATPLRLQGEGHGVPVSYAEGRLALWAPDASPDADPKAALTHVRHVAIANPDLAPYGKATVAAIEGMGLTGALENRIVTGENVGQAFALVKSRAAEAGFIAASALGPDDGGLRWIVTPALYPQIRQDAILLRHGAENRAAQGFMLYLTSAPAQAIIEAAGYGIPR